MNGLTLRDYQRDAIDIGIYAYYQENFGNALIVIPTAGGKSLVIAKFLHEVYEQWPDQRILILTHVREIISQNYAELIELWPDAPVGINSAGLKSRDLTSPIIIAGIQSIYKHAAALPRIDLVIVDEAHLIPRTDTTRYRKLLSDLAELNSYMKVIGLTATPFRLDSGMLHEGPDALFTDISYEVSVRHLIEKGWLCPPRTLRAETQIDTSDVGTRGGEFIPGELEAAATDPGTVSYIADEIVRNSENRYGLLLFGCGIKHAEMMQEAMIARGITCACIFGHTKPRERDEIIRAFKAQEIQALSAMNVLTTGFNARHVDLIALARPTKSTGLYVQMVGRGLRTFPGKENCLVLDFGGNIARHGPIDDPRVHTEERGKGEGKGKAAPIKICPDCRAIWSIAVQICFCCGHEFKAPERQLNLHASQADILRDLEPKWLRVDQVRYAVHHKDGKPPSLRVEYHCGLSVHREWICLEHDNYPRERAIAWWRSRAPGIPVPNSIDEAMDSVEYLAIPSEIRVRPSGRFTEICGAKL